MPKYHKNQCDHCGQQTTHGEDEVCLRCGNHNPPGNFPTIGTDDYKTIVDSIEAHIKQCIENCNILISNKKRNPWKDIVHTFKLIIKVIGVDRFAERIINEQKETDHD